MKVGKSLTELAIEIERQQATKRDFIANTAGGVTMTPDSMLKVGNGDGLVAQVNDIAHRQISDHVGIPAKYYDRMKAEAPELLAQNVNTWFTQNQEKRMIRTLDGKVRAFLSDRYRPLENAQLAEAVLPVLMELGVEIMSAEITERRLYIKAVDGKIRYKLPEGAKWGQGHTIVREQCPVITIGNSEVGMGALSIDAGVYDSICTNLGTFSGSGLRKYHVGGKHELFGEELHGLLSDKTRALTDAALWHQVRDVVKGAFDEAVFTQRCQKIEATQEDRIEDVEKVVELVSNKFSMVEGERKSVLKHLIEGGNLSRFGVYNAITRAAQDLPDYDRATDFERFGGKLVELPKNEWQALTA